MVKRSGKKSRGNSGGAKLKRRWFANATGWGFSLSIGSGASQPVGASKTKRSLNLGDETQLVFGTTTVSPTHNTFYSFNPLIGISSGAGTSGRLGDRIYLENVSIRCILSNASSSDAINGKSFRFLLVASTAQSNNSTWSTANINAANVFRQDTSDQLLSVGDPQLCRVLCDEVVTLQAMIAAQQIQYYFTLDCPVKEWFEFQPGTGLGVAANLYWVLVAEEYGTTTGTTVVGTVATSFLVAYRNSN
jgi:hypothetical protein